jgi:hypothetical protein
MNPSAFAFHSAECDTAPCAPEDDKEFGKLAVVGTGSLTIDGLHTSFAV